jgi:hypothetical protein
MIPFSTLRTSHLYSGMADNPLGINPPRGPANNGPDWITSLALQRGEQGRSRLLQIADAAAQRHQQEQDQVNAAAHPNVVFNPGINPLQQANLNLKQQAEQGKNERADESIASREKLATSSLNEKQQYGNTVNAIRSKMADIASFKAQHPNVQMYAPKGGNVHYFDPAHPELGMQDTGVDTGSLSQKDAADLGLQNQLAEIAARGDQSRQTDSQRSNENITAIGARGSQQRLTNAARASSAATKPQSENDKKVGYYNRAMELANDPGFGKYIVKGDKANDFSLSPDTPPDLYHQINEKIYGNPAAQDIDLPAEKHEDPLGILSKDQE